MALERSPLSLVRRLDSAFPLQALAAVRDMREYLDRVEKEALLEGRTRGASPTDMAEALGVSRQAIYGKLRAIAPSD